MKCRKKKKHMDEKTIAILWCLGSGFVCVCGGLKEFSDFKDGYMSRYSNDWSDFVMGVFATSLGLLVFGVGIVGLVG
jgi:hypothetical protein